MTGILIFGNSGSGKSTLAKKLCAREGLAHLDVDALAWLLTMPPQRKPLSESQAAIAAFMRANEDWVIEGCYSDLLGFAMAGASEVIFMNLPVALCIENARKRPWEPHKYESKAAQDAKLDMLIDWIAQYPHRDDEFSQAAHQRLYATFTGAKRSFLSNDVM